MKELPPGSLLVTLDVSSLYTNIPHNEGIEACRKALNSSDHLSRSHFKTEFICDLMCMILTMNNFEFDNNYYIQFHGTAMGTRMAPAYANLFIGYLERKLLAQSPLKPLKPNSNSLLKATRLSQTLFLIVMMAAVALANLLLMVLHPIHFTTLENNIKSHIVCSALQTTSYIKSIVNVA